VKKERKKEERNERNRMKKYVPDEFSSLERLDGEGDRTIQ